MKDQAVTECQDIARDGARSERIRRERLDEAEFPGVSFRLPVAGGAAGFCPPFGRRGVRWATKKLELKGVVTRMEWTNPHAHFFLDVKGADGTVTNWNLELASPSILLRNGWKRDSLKAGDAVTVDGSPAERQFKVRHRANRSNSPMGHKLGFLSAYDDTK